MDDIFKLAVESSSNHIIITDPNGHITYVNKAAEEITGYNKSEILGKTPKLWGGLMEEDLYKKLWHTISIEKKPFKAEITNKRKNGEIYTAIARISPILDRNKKILGFVGTEEDISKKIELEKELVNEKNSVAKEKAQDEAILNNIADALVVCDVEGCVTLVNTAAEKLLGVSKKTLENTFFVKSIHFYDGSNVLISPKNRPLTLVLHNGNVISTKFIYHKNGKDIFLGVTVAPVILEGKIIGVVQIMRDVTREEEVDRMKTEFISLASHQLRTPLSAIKWFLELLLDGDAGKLADEQRLYLQNINQSNQRMIQLVNSLLNISRIESGRIIVDPVFTDMPSLLKEIISELRPEFEEKKQTLVVSIHPNLPHIFIDPKLITEVYINLLTNANKYAPEGSEITLIISKKDDSILSQVSDTGPGIPANQQNRIFQKFFRAENVVKLETTGSGLGLYLTKAIVAMSGGKIWFDSTVGKGTTFWFTLPLGGMKPCEGEVALDTSIPMKMFLSQKRKALTV